RWVAIKDDYSLDRNVVQAGFDEPEYGARKMHNWSKQLVIQPAAAPLSAMQLATHLVSHSEARKVVNESRKKREAAAKPAAVALREIKSVAGDQKVPTPGELAKLKFENDRRIHQLIIEQRQATAAAAALAMQQQRALNPQLQHIQLSRQIAALQAMLASGRGLQRPLTPVQSRIIQQQIQNLQGLQQQQQAQAQMQHMQMQLAQAAAQQQAQLAAGQGGGAQQAQQQLLGAMQANGGQAGVPGMRFTPEQIQQILQARAAGGARPNLPPALAAVLNARAQMAGAGGGGVRPQAMPRPMSPAAAVAAANMLPPQQRQMAQAQAQSQGAMNPAGQMQRPPPNVPGAPSPVAAMAQSPQMGAPAMQSPQPGAGASPATEAAAPEQHTPQMMGSPGGAMQAQAQAQAQAFLAAQQAMQAKQLQMQQQLQHQAQAGVNQPQLAQYLSSLYPHQLAQISNHQRMGLLAMRQQQQQPQPQLQQHHVPNHAALQALQQSLLAGSGAGAMGGFGGLGPAASQQLFAAQNMKMKPAQPPPQPN
ncbi:hypothetical protein GGI02_005390, partial [Coemansia sp. RSA 2322]